MGISPLERGISWLSNGKIPVKIRYNPRKSRRYAKFIPSQVFVHRVSGMAPGSPATGVSAPMLVHGGADSPATGVSAPMLVHGGAPARPVGLRDVKQGHAVPGVRMPFLPEAAGFQRVGVVIQTEQNHMGHI